jgi:hypothetical protein
MRIQSCIAFALVVLLFICTYWHGTMGIVSSEHATIEDIDLPGHDIVQRTCALDVVVRSFVTRTHAFDLDLPDTLMPPPSEVPASEPMLACTAPPAEQMDTAGTATSSDLGPDRKDTHSPARWNVDASEPLLACVPPPPVQWNANERVDP